MENIDLTIEKTLETYCESHWWNRGKKTLYFKGTLKELLKRHSLIFEIEKVECPYSCIVHFKNPNGISFTQKDLLSNFVQNAKLFIQFEMVRYGTKSQLFIKDTIHPNVTVNF